MLCVRRKNEMAKVKKIRLFPIAKLQAVIMAIVGLIAGILYSVGGELYMMYS